MYIHIWLSAFGTGQHLKQDLSATQRGDFLFFWGVFLVGMEEMRIPWTPEQG